MRNMLYTRFARVTIIVSVVVFAVGFVGIRAWACDSGCNYGQIYGCFNGGSDCGTNNTCEEDICNPYPAGCIGNNHFRFCVASYYLCHYPSCSWVGNCCDIP
jgi:hypothetical protein